MKKLMFTLAVCIGVLSARASYLPSELTIRMWDYSIISVVFDGQVYDHYNTAYTISGINGGRHYMKVNRYFTTPNGGVSSFPKMVFSGYITIRPGLSVDAMIDHNSRLVILSETSLTPANPYNNPYHNNPHDNYYTPYYNDGYASYSGMNHYDFNELKAIVSNTSFDNTRLTICKQAISSNRISSSQVFELMTLLTFESNKLDLAKYAWFYVTDINRYYLVNNAFTFSSSIDELNRFISSH